MTFKQWLRLHPDAYPTSGHLTVDILDDDTFPMTNDFSKALNYLREKWNIDRKQAHELNEAWKLYLDFILYDNED